LQPPATGAPAVLSSIVIDPFNLKSEPVTPTNLVFIDFNATLFYVDPVTQDRRVRAYVVHSGTPQDPIDPDTNIVWSLRDNQGNLITTPVGANGRAAGFTNTDPAFANRCYFNDLLQTSQLRVRATLGNVVSESPLIVDISQGP
jgi:hypothetical protein